MVSARFAPVRALSLCWVRTLTAGGAAAANGLAFVSLLSSASEGPQARKPAARRKAIVDGNRNGKLLIARFARAGRVPFEIQAKRSRKRDGPRAKFGRHC